MKTKHFFMILAVSFFFASCSEESENIATTTDEGQVLRFASQEAMNSKITEIEAFKANQEAEILNKILKRNNLSAPTLEMVKNAPKVELTDFDQTKILEDVKFYHQEKLKAIYAERAHFGFTSIQSIADEINFLSLIDKKKSEEIYRTHSNYLNKTVSYTAPKKLSSISLIMNEKGAYELKGEIVKSSFTETNKSNPLWIHEGILTSAYFNGGLYSITWHAGVEDYTSFTQFGAFLNGYLYPTWFYANSNSEATFCQGLTCFVIEFPTSAGNFVRNSVTKNSPFPVGGGIAGGTFATFVNGQLISVSGSVNFN